MKTFTISTLGAGLIAIALFTFMQSAQGSHHNKHGGHDPHCAHGDQTQNTNGDYTNFPTVGWEQTVEVNIPHPSEEVCPLFEPSGRFLVYKWWNPATTLRQPNGDNLEGLVTVSNTHGHDIVLMVTEHDPDEGTMQYLVLWDDFELQRIDISCTANDNNSTKVVWLERNAGIHENGVSMVSSFVEKGHLVNVVNRYAERVDEYLQD